jgi:hypothetical protein
MLRPREVMVYSRLETPEIPPPGYLAEYTVDRNRAIARVVATLIGGAFSEASAADVPPGAYVIPDRPLYRHEALPLGIKDEGDLFGGVVTTKLHHDKAILHPLVNGSTTAPGEYSHNFSKAISGAVLPGYTAFIPDDVRKAFTQLQSDGFEVRCKDPSCEGGNGQQIVSDLAQLEYLIAQMSLEKIASEGAVLEPNILDPVTLSIGQIYLDGEYFSYFGDQQSTLLDGNSTYGGTTLTMFRGDLANLSNRLEDSTTKTAVDQARVVHDAYSHYDPTISRLNFDVVQGGDTNGNFHSGVVDQSLRIGGASPAEVIAIRELSADATADSVTTRVAVNWDSPNLPVGEEDVVFFDHPRRRDVVSVLSRQCVQSAMHETA